MKNEWMIDMRQKNAVVYGAYYILRQISFSLSTIPPNLEILFDIFFIRMHSKSYAINGPRKLKSSTLI